MCNIDDDEVVGLDARVATRSEGSRFNLEPNLERCQIVEVAKVAETVYRETLP